MRLSPLPSDHKIVTNKEKNKIFMLFGLLFLFDLGFFEAVRCNYYTRFWVYLDQIISLGDNKVNKIFKLVYQTNANCEKTNLQEPNLKRVNLTKANIKMVLLDRYKASRKECLENVTKKRWRSIWFWTNKFIQSNLLFCFQI
jgi:hypothetical protein